MMQLNRLELTILRGIIEEVDSKLKGIMKNIYKNISGAAKEYGKSDDFILGANIAGFKKVAQSMLDQGIV